MTIDADVTDPQMKQMLALCRAEVPEFRIEFKEDSKLMHFLSLLLFFNRGFMDKYITTLGSTIYFPTRAGFLAQQYSYVEVLAHELVHMKESSHRGRLQYSVSYLFPQILALLSLLTCLAPLNPWFLLCLCFLVFLAPIPSVSRCNIELNGYTMSLAVVFWRTGVITDADLDWTASQFTGPAYYWMYPWAVLINSELRLRAIRIRTDQVMSKHVFQKVYAVVHPRS